MPASTPPDGNPACWAAELGARVKAYRDAVGITQQTLAERAGLTASGISGIERGKRNLTVKNLLRLADALQSDTIHVAPGDLLNGLPVPPLDD